MTFEDLSEPDFKSAFLDQTMRGIIGFVFHLAVYAFFFETHFSNLRSDWKWLALASMLMTLAIRLGLLHFTKRTTKMLPRRTLILLFRFTASAVGLTWGLIFVCAYREFGFGIATMELAAALTGFGTSGIAVSPMDAPSATGYLFFSYVPIIAVNFGAESSQFVNRVSVFFLMQFVFSLSAIRRSKISFFTTYQQKNRIESQHRELEAILNAVPGFVIWLDEQGRYLGVNSRFAHEINQSPAELVGHKPHQFSDHSEISSIESRFRDTGEHELVQEMFADLAGEKRWYLIALRKVQGSSRNQIVMIAIDISAEKSAREQLAAELTRASQNERLALAGAMAGGIAHEINNPLAIISGRLERIESGATSGELTLVQVAEIATKGIATVGRIASIVRGLRLMARGAGNESKSNYDLVQMITDAIGMCAARASEKGIRVELETDRPSLNYECEATQLSQIVINLVQNAFDSIESLEKRWIKVALRETETSIEISVTDSGNFETIQNPQKLFEPFYTTKPAGKGTGLGLSVSQSLAKRHDGDLILSADNKHVRFTLQLPKIARSTPQVVSTSRVA